MEKLQKLALAITIIGALNWGVVGIFRFDVVAQLTDGAYQPLARFIYVLIGISAIFSLSVLFRYWHTAEHEERPLTASPEKI